MFQPPYSTSSGFLADLHARGYAVLRSAEVLALARVNAADLAVLRADWPQLEPDEYLKDRGRYRRRRHASFVLDGDALHNVAHRAHWQPLSYNALHGGMLRWFAPVAKATLRAAPWCALLQWTGAVATKLLGPQRWYGEAHQFRIDTSDGIGRPTPEGAHRDGVDFVAVFFVGRDNIKGGETRVFELDGPNGQRFTLDDPWSVLLLNDQEVIHESTPIQPLIKNKPGHRDTLVVTLRAAGFLEPQT